LGLLHVFEIPDCVRSGTGTQIQNIHRKLTLNPDNVDLAGQLSDVSLYTTAAEEPGYMSQSSGNFADVSNAESDTQGR
jgi:hypothetical protein